MCLIILDPNKEGEPIPFETIEKAMERNSHGSGYAFPNTKRNKVIVRKMYKDPSKLYSKYVEDLKVFGAVPFLFHFRLKTHGDINLRNTQPLSVSSHLVMAHNGVLSTGVLPTSRVSDSFLYAKALNFNGVTTLNDLSNPDLMKAGSSKIVFLDSKGGVKIVNESIGNWEDGRWYSNGSMSNKAQRFLPHTTLRCFRCGTTTGSLRLFEKSFKETVWGCSSCISENQYVIVECAKCKNNTRSCYKENDKPICFSCKYTSNSTYTVQTKHTFRCAQCKSHVTNGDKYGTSIAICEACHKQEKDLVECSECKGKRFSVDSNGVCTPCLNEKRKPVCSECKQKSYSLLGISETMYLCPPCMEKVN